MRTSSSHVLMWMLFPSIALAQWGAGAPEEAPPRSPGVTPETYVAPEPPPTPIAPAPIALERPPRNFRFISTANMGVPILLDVDREVVRPGANLNGRFVFSSRFVGAGFQGGFQWVPMDLGRTNDIGFGRQRRSPMRRGYLGPIVHFQLPLGSALTPYAQAGFDLNFWNFRETAVTCDAWYCYSSKVYRFAPGFHGRLGGRIAMRPDSAFRMDLGVEIGTSLRGEFFNHSQPHVMPFLGIGLTN